MDAAELLSTGELFSALPTEAIHALAVQCEVRTLEPGAILVRAGSPHTAVVWRRSGSGRTTRCPRRGR